MATEELTVLCGNVGWKWDDVWVQRLERMVREHCSVPHRFICVSDHPIPEVQWIQASPIHLDENKPQGCWVKLDYFRREVSGDGPCIALDLDTTIVGEIAGLCREHLSAAQDPRKAKAVGRYLNSSVMSWTPSAETDAIYTDNIPYEEHPRGDQEYIAKMYPEYGVLPNVYSYKGHLNGQSRLVLPKDTAVVFCHGKPTPASPELMRHGWNSRSWRGLEVRERNDHRIQG